MVASDKLADDGTSDASDAVDSFMLEEYKTIAAAHFDLHSGLRQNFRFSLGIAALPFTVMAVAFKDQALSLFKLPQVMILLFLVAPVIGLLLFVHMVNSRFDIILYTRTVNGVRGYFVARSRAISPAIVLPDYLKLPTDTLRPPYRESPSRAYWWLFFMIAVINSVYAFVVAANFLSLCAAVVTSVLFLLVHGAVYYGLSGARERKEIPANVARRSD